MFAFLLSFFPTGMAAATGHMGNSLLILASDIILPGVLKHPGFSIYS